MQCILLDGTGAGAMRLGTRPDPKPGPGEISIQVAYAGVNRPDILQRDGLSGRQVPRVERCGGAPSHSALVPRGAGPSRAVPSLSRLRCWRVATIASSGGTINSVSTAESARPPITTEPSPR